MAVPRWFSKQCAILWSALKSYRALERALPSASFDYVVDTDLSVDLLRLGSTRAGDGSVCALIAAVSVTVTHDAVLLAL